MPYSFSIPKFFRFFKRMCVALTGVKGRWFNYQLGHMPELWARSLVGGMRGATDVSLSHSCFSPSLSPPLPLMLKINK